MTKIKAVLVAAVAVLVLGAGAAWAAGAFRPGTTARTTPSEPKVYGACVNTRTGLLRILERNNLHKSQWGACRQDGSERFISFPSGTAVTPGTQPFLTGKGAPAASKGKAGQFYYDTAAGVLYGPKTAQGWGEGIPLRGADGKDGKDGAPGADGRDGKDGAPGKSAYEVWRDTQPEGADTSLDAFFESLRGPKGEPGEPGKDGRDAEINEDVVRDLLYQVWRAAQPGDTNVSEEAFRAWLRITPASPQTPIPTPSPDATE